MKRATPDGVAPRRPGDAGPIKDLAMQHAPRAIETLVEALTDENVRARMAAAEAILDRAYGKPTQHHELDADDELVRRMNQAARRLHGTR